MAKQDLEALLNAVLPIAMEQLKRRGQLAPFAMSMSQGKMAMKAADAGSAQESLDTLRAGLRAEAEAGQIQCAAVIYDSRFRSSPALPAQDAICVQLEDREGGALAMHMPYAKKLFRGYEFRDPVPSGHRPTIFDAAVPKH